MEIKGGMSMFDQLRSIRGVQDIIPKTKIETGDGLSTGQPAAGNKVSFSDFLSQQFEEANTLGVEAEKAIQRSIMGEEKDPHSAMIAVQKADISLSLLMSLKDRIERAYQELIRTPI